jgi:hypothetical protein
LYGRKETGSASGLSSPGYRQLKARESDTAQPACDRQSVRVIVTTVFLLLAIMVLVVMARGP